MCTLMFSLSLSLTHTQRYKERKSERKKSTLYATRTDIMYTMSHSRPDIKHVSHRLVTRRTILDGVKLDKEVDNKFLIMHGAYILVIA